MVIDRSRRVASPLGEDLVTGEVIRRGTFNSEREKERERETIKIYCISILVYQ